MSEGKLEQLIKQKRDFLRQATKDYSSGGNDMLDDVECSVERGKRRTCHRLDVASCLLKMKVETAWLRGALTLYSMMV